MRTKEPNKTYDLHPERDAQTFRDVPEDTRELWITMLRPEEVSELSALGQRLKKLQKLSLRYGEVEDVDFLDSFGSIESLSCLLARLKRFEGIGSCVNLTTLNLGSSLSSVGKLTFLGHLPKLERLRLEGPHPSKGVEKIGAMNSLKVLDLYAPKWDLNLLPEISPALDTLAISQGGYPGLEFIGDLQQLTTLDIAYARKLVRFESIGLHPRLNTVKLGYALSGLSDSSQLGHSASIQRLSFTACKELKDVTALSEWPALRDVGFSQCPKIPEAQVEMLRKAGKRVNGK